MRAFFSRKIYERMCVTDKYMALLGAQAAVANHSRPDRLKNKTKNICYRPRDSEVQI